MSDKKIIIYMPALNEQKTIKRVLQSIPKKIKGFNEVFLLVVNDGSKDKTEIEAKTAGAIVLNHSVNKGVGAAFHTAVNYTLKVKADVLVSIDADGQFDVNQIKDMIAPLVNETADFSIGNRFNSLRPDKMPKIKFLGNKMVNKIVGFSCRTKINDASCGFRAYSKECLLNLNLEGSFTYTHETILDLINKGFIVEQVPVNVVYFEDRVSRVANNVIQYGVKTSSIIFKSLKDYRPLPFFLSIAFVLFLIAFLLGGFTTIHWFINGAITPYKSLGIISLALLGMSLLVTIFAFMADMLGRIRNNQEKILYFLKKQKFEN